MCDKELEESTDPGLNECEKCGNEIEQNKALFQIPQEGNEEMNRRINKSFVW